MVINKIRAQRLQGLSVAAIAAAVDDQVRERRGNFENSAVFLRQAVHFRIPSYIVLIVLGARPGDCRRSAPVQTIQPLSPTKNIRCPTG